MIIEFIAKLIEQIKNLLDDISMVEIYINHRLSYLNDEFNKAKFNKIDLKKEIKFLEKELQ